MGSPLESAELTGTAGSDSKTAIHPAADHAINDRSPSARSPLTRLQCEAIRVGINDGRLAKRDARSFGFFRLFARPVARPLADKQLEALRAWAELVSAIGVGGTDLPTRSLEDVGLDSGRITEAQQFLVAELSRLEGQK